MIAPSWKQCDQVHLPTGLAKHLSSAGRGVHTSATHGFHPRPLPHHSTGPRSCNLPSRSSAYPTRQLTPRGTDSAPPTRTGPDGAVHTIPFCSACPAADALPQLRARHCHRCRVTLCEASRSDQPVNGCCYTACSAHAHRCKSAGPTLHAACTLQAAVALPAATVRRNLSIAPATSHSSHSRAAAADADGACQGRCRSTGARSQAISSFADSTPRGHLAGVNRSMPRAQPAAWCTQPCGPPTSAVIVRRSACPAPRPLTAAPQAG